MMNVIYNPNRSQWHELTQRPVFDVTELFSVVSPIFNAVSERGDDALKELELQFDKVSLQTLRVGDDEINEADSLLDTNLKDAINKAYDNIYAFHDAQRFEQIEVETMPGVKCVQKAVPVEKVGLYIPGGTAPLFSTVLMLGVPAKIAGCKQVIVCTPPSCEGKVNPAILYAAKCCGITEIFKIGGAQAIAAMSVGTASLPKVDKIFGPGNQYVMAAKQLAALSNVAIDMPAGPSEVEVLVDDTCVPAFVAADLLSQAEHGPDSQVVLVSTTDNDVVKLIEEELEHQLNELPRKDFAAKALRNSRCVLFDNMQDAIDFTNEYAPEHLIIAAEDYNDIANQITHAGSVFLGNYSCESAGDYASGTNHTLPTKAWAKAYSGLCLDSFIRKITFQEITEEGVKNLAGIVETMAEAECLDAHKNAMKFRRKSLNI